MIGGVGLLFLAVHIALGINIVHRVLRADAVFVEYEYAVYAAPKALQPFVAQGRWAPAGLRHRFGAFFNAWRPEGLWMTYIALGRPVAVGFLANLDAPDAAWCTAQFVTLGAFSVITGLLVLVCRPHRAPGRTVAVALSACVTGLVLSSPAVPGSSAVVGWLVLGATALSVVVAGVTAGFNQYERSVMKEREPALADVVAEAKAGKRALVLPLLNNSKGSRDDSASRSASEDDAGSADDGNGRRNPLLRL